MAAAAAHRSVNEIRRMVFDQHDLWKQYYRFNHREYAQEGYACASRPELTEWESRVKTAAEKLSLNENKKLHLMATRLWKRMANAG